GRDRELVAAGLDRESLEGLDVIARYADDGGAELAKARRGVGERLRLDGAARREGLRVEVEHHRTPGQGVGQAEGEGLAAERGFGGEIRRIVARLECRVRGYRAEGDRDGERCEETAKLHGSPPLWGRLFCAMRRRAGR